MSDLVEFRHLKYIVAVADAANITRAAERLFLAQPSLSKQVKDLEDEIGFPIFVRTRQGVRITPPGQMIVDYAQEALLKRTKIIAMARAVHRGEVPPFRLGFSSFINPDLLQLFRDAYASLFPDCLIHLSGGDPLHLRATIRSTGQRQTKFPIQRQLGQAYSGSSERRRIGHGQAGSEVVCVDKDRGKPRDCGVQGRDGRRRRRGSIGVWADCRASCQRRCAGGHGQIRSSMSGTMCRSCLKTTPGLRPRRCSSFCSGRIPVAFRTGRCARCSGA